MAEEIKIRTFSIRKFVREMELNPGDQFLLYGYSSNKNIQSDVFKLREELGIDLEISQKELIIVDPVEKNSLPCWLITVVRGSNTGRKFKPLGRKKHDDQLQKSVS